MRPILRSFGGDRSSIQVIIRGWHLTKNTPIALHLVKLGRAKVVFFSQILIPRYIPSSEVGTRGLVTSDWCIPKRRAYKRLIKPPADCRGAQKKNVMQSMTRTSQQVRQGVLELQLRLIVITIRCKNPSCDPVVHSYRSSSDPVRSDLPCTPRRQQPLER